MDNIVPLIHTANPVWLSDEEIEHPEQVVLAFFEDYRGGEFRKLFGELKHYLTCYDEALPNNSYRSNILFFLCATEKLIDASGVLAQKAGVIIPYDEIQEKIDKPAKKLTANKTRSTDKNKKKLA